MVIYGNNRYLAQTIAAVIQIAGAVKPGEADWALAAVVGPVIDTTSSVLAGIMSFCAEGNFLLTIFSRVSRGAVASVGLDEVNTSRVIITLVVRTVVDVVFTAKSLVAGRTVATDTQKL